MGKQRRKGKQHKPQHQHHKSGQGSHQHHKHHGGPLYDKYHHHQQQDKEQYDDPSRNEEGRKNNQGNDAQRVIEAAAPRVVKEGEVLTFMNKDPCENQPPKNKSEREEQPTHNGQQDSPAEPTIQPPGVSLKPTDDYALDKKKEEEGEEEDDGTAASTIEAIAEDQNEPSTEDKNMEMKENHIQQGNQILKNKETSGAPALPPLTENLSAEERRTAQELPTRDTDEKKITQEDQQQQALLALRQKMDEDARRLDDLINQRNAQQPHSQPEPETLKELEESSNIDNSSASSRGISIAPVLADNAKQLQKNLGEGVAVKGKDHSLQPTTEEENVTIADKNRNVGGEIVAASQSSSFLPFLPALSRLKKRQQQQQQQQQQQLPQKDEDEEEEKETVNSAENDENMMLTHQRNQDKPSPPPPVRFMGEEDIDLHPREEKKEEEFPTVTTYDRSFHFDDEANKNDPATHMTHGERAPEKDLAGANHALSLMMPSAVQRAGSYTLSGSSLDPELCYLAAKFLNRQQQYRQQQQQQEQQQQQQKPRPLSECNPIGEEDAKETTIEFSGNSNFSDNNNTGGAESKISGANNAQSNDSKSEQANGDMHSQPEFNERLLDQLPQPPKETEYQNTLGGDTKDPGDGHTVSTTREDPNSGDWDVLAQITQQANQVVSQQELSHTITPDPTSMPSYFDQMQKNPGYMSPLSSYNFGQTNTDAGTGLDQIREENDGHSVFSGFSSIFSSSFHAMAAPPPPKEAAEQKVAPQPLVHSMSEESQQLDDLVKELTEMASTAGSGTTSDTASRRVNSYGGDSEDEDDDEQIILLGEDAESSPLAGHETPRARESELFQTRAMEPHLEKLDSEESHEETLIFCTEVAVQTPVSETCRQERDEADRNSEGQKIQDIEGSEISNKNETLEVDEKPDNRQIKDVELSATSDQNEAVVAEEIPETEQIENIEASGTSDEIELLYHGGVIEHEDSTIVEDEGKASEMNSLHAKTLEESAIVEEDGKEPEMKILHPETLEESAIVEEDGKEPEISSLHPELLEESATIDNDEKAPKISSLHPEGLEESATIDNDEKAPKISSLHPEGLEESATIDNEEKAPKISSLHPEELEESAIADKDEGKALELNPLHPETLEKSATLEEDGSAPECGSIHPEGLEESAIAVKDERKAQDINPLHPETLEKSATLEEDGTAPECGSLHNPAASEERAGVKDEGKVPEVSSLHPEELEESAIADKDEGKAQELNPLHPETLEKGATLEEDGTAPECGSLHHPAALEESAGVKDEGKVPEANSLHHRTLDLSTFNDTKASSIPRKLLLSAFRKDVDGQIVRISVRALGTSETISTEQFAFGRMATLFNNVSLSRAIIGARTLAREQSMKCSHVILTVASEASQKSILRSETDVSEFGFLEPRMRVDGSVSEQILSISGSESKNVEVAKAGVLEWMKYSHLTHFASKHSLVAVFDAGDIGDFTIAHVRRKSEEKIKSWCVSNSRRMDIKVVQHKRLIVIAGENKELFEKGKNIITSTFERNVPGKRITETKPEPREVILSSDNTATDDEVQNQRGSVNSERSKPRDENQLSGASSDRAPTPPSARNDEPTKSHDKSKPSDATTGETTEKSCSLRDIEAIESNDVISSQMEHPSTGGDAVIDSTDKENKETTAESPSRADGDKKHTPTTPATVTSDASLTNASSHLEGLVARRLTFDEDSKEETKIEPEQTDGKEKARTEQAQTPPSTDERVILRATSEGVALFDDDDDDDDGILEETLETLGQPEEEEFASSCNNPRVFLSPLTANYRALRDFTFPTSGTEAFRHPSKMALTRFGKRDTVWNKQTTKATSSRRQKSLTDRDPRTPDFLKTLKHMFSHRKKHIVRSITRTDEEPANYVVKLQLALKFNCAPDCRFQSDVFEPGQPLVKERQELESLKEEPDSKESNRAESTQKKENQNESNGSESQSKQRGRSPQVKKLPGVKIKPMYVNLDNFVDKTKAAEFKEEWMRWDEQLRIEQDALMANKYLATLLLGANEALKLLEDRNSSRDPRWADRLAFDEGDGFVSLGANEDDTNTNTNTNTNNEDSTAAFTSHQEPDPDPVALVTCRSHDFLMEDADMETVRKALRYQVSGPRFSRKPRKTPRRVPRKPTQANRGPSLMCFMPDNSTEVTTWRK